MTRLSVTLDDFLEEQLRKVQGQLIIGRKRDVSFTTTANVVLMGGILGSKYLKEKDWQHIRDFLNDKQINIDAEGLTDNYLNSLK